jgi:hypothetical protein
VTIPRTLHQLWIGRPVPEHIAEYMQTWRDRHPDWEYRLWTEKELGELPMVNRWLYDNACRFALPGRCEQFRSDIARYEILATHGGVYIDADFECLRPIDPLLRSPLVHAFSAWEEDQKWINLAVYGTEPNHQFVHDLRLGLTAHVKRLTLNGTRPNTGSRLSGPRYLTRVWERNSYDPGLVVYPREWFYPYAWNELHRGDEKFDDAYAVHHWHNQRTNGRRKGL